MNSITATVWDEITDDENLLAELTAIMRKEYKPFLSPAQTLQANTHQLEQHMREQLTTWYEWLPDTPINHIGGELAMEVLDAVEWSLIAEHLLKNMSQAVGIPSPSK
jgi:hypothetical protein